MNNIYGMEITDEALAATLRRIQNQVFRILPAREEGEDWIKPLETLIVEICGMSHLLPNLENLVKLLNKLEGMKELGNDLEFFLFRRQIFECCSLIGELIPYVNANS